MKLDQTKSLQKMIITLIGYRGTGKTTIAAPLAARLNWDWIDADVELERQAGRTIREIFDSDGEVEFRRIERQVLIDLLRRDRLVIAAGGGAILDHETRKDMPNAGPVVWLQTTVNTIESRICGDETTHERRPNLTSEGGRNEIERLLALREPLYRETATITVKTDAISVDEIVDYIVSSVEGILDQESSA